ncbi:hypothetical protein [Sporolactobacillus terrae]|uniref:hypothetical protein n=1 Tax=Sporolactobacillus terrae TaxID=269673 RepID=UPI000ACE7591|nr:hypothetical protein [Sporolactobacillus terrae]
MTIKQCKRLIGKQIHNFVIIGVSEKMGHAIVHCKLTDTGRTGSLTGGELKKLICGI